MPRLPSAAARRPRSAGSPGGGGQLAAVRWLRPTRGRSANLGQFAAVRGSKATKICRIVRRVGPARGRPAILVSPAVGRHPADRCVTRPRGDAEPTVPSEETEEVRCVLASGARASVRTRIQGVTVILLSDSPQHQRRRARRPPATPRRPRPSQLHGTCCPRSPIPNKFPELAPTRQAPSIHSGRQRCGGEPPRTAMVGNGLLHEFVHIAPTPRFPRLQRAHHRMARGVEMLRRMLAGRGIATVYFATFHTQTKVNPVGMPSGQAFLTALRRLLDRVLDPLREMYARCHYSFRFNIDSSRSSSR
jgi:hypothetical protein